MEENQMQIPEGWSKLYLNEIFEFKYGANLPTIDFSTYGFPVYGANGIIGFHSKFNYINSEILISCRGENSGVINVSKEKAFITNNSIVCKYKFEVDKVFFYYNLKTIDRLKMVSGSAQPQVVIKDLKKIDIVFPKSITEQQAIANILSKTDQAITNTEALIAKYTKIKTGLMQNLLTKGIDENGNIRTEQTHEFKDSPLGRIPKEWECIPLGTCIELHNNKRKPISAQIRSKMIGDYPYYGATGIIDKISEYKVEGEFVLFGEDGDHFLKWVYQEQTALVNGRFNVSNHAHIVKGNHRSSTKWIHYFYCHRDITFYLTRQGAGRFKLNKASLLSLPILLPISTTEQDLIIDRIEKVNEYSDNLYSELTKLQSLKTGLMQDLLSGKVRVNNLMKEKQ